MPLSVSVIIIAPKIKLVKNLRCERCVLSLRSLREKLEMCRFTFGKFDWTGSWLKQHTY